MTSPRPFRFGASGHAAASGEEWRQAARRVEAQGYATLHLSDHVLDGLSPIPALAVAAEATTTLRVGPLVLDNDFRNPVLLAKELATVDLLSGGRLEWGMGAGWLPLDYERSGIAFERPGVRLRRLKEAVRLMQRLLAGEEVTHEGRRYRVAGASVVPGPVQRPHPPLLIGGQGRKLLTFATRRADIVGVNTSMAAQPFMGPKRITAAAAADAQLDWIRAAATSRPELPELQMVAHPVVVTPDRRQVLGPWADSQGLPVDAVAEAPQTLVGTVDQICEALEERRRRWSISYWTVPLAAADAFAPVVERLAGR